MRENLRLVDYIMLTIAGVVLALVLAVNVRAEQPECTGDRHYDGVACCPVVDPAPTTTTTVPDGTSCPEPGPCPTVTCDCTGYGETTVNNVTVNRCPEAPNYLRCKRKRDGTYRCPTKFAPRRIFMPEGRAG